MDEKLDFIDLECPKCGAALSISGNATRVKCEYCDREFIIVPENESFSLAEKEETDYQLEHGREEPIRDTEGNNFSEEFLYFNESIDNKAGSEFVKQNQNRDTIFRRMNRKPFAIKFVLLWVVCHFIVRMFIEFLGAHSIGVDIVIMLTLAISVYLIIRRLHDLNRSAWLSVIMFIPGINLVFAAYLFLAKGTDGTNRFGVDPLEAL